MKLKRYNADNEWNMGEHPDGLYELHTEAEQSRKEAFEAGKRWHINQFKQNLQHMMDKLTPTPGKEENGRFRDGKLRSECCYVCGSQLSAKQMENGLCGLHSHPATYKEADKEWPCLEVDNPSVCSHPSCNLGHLVSIEIIDGRTPTPDKEKLR